MNIKDHSGRSALHHTVSGGFTETCQMLVSAGADVNIRDNSESTPLHLALARKQKNKKLEICQILISGGADLNAKVKNSPYYPPDKEAPLHLAVLAVIDYGSGLEFVRLLVAAGADVNITDSSFLDLTPLHLAFWPMPGNLYSYKKQLELCRILISGGADLNAQGKHGGTPLHWAVWVKCWSVELVQLFISAGADLNIQNKSGQTHLHLLLKIKSKRVRFHKALVDLFIQHGTDLKLEDSMGDTPLTLLKNCPTCQKKYIT